MSFEHVMLDLETLSSGPRAAILSIGAVRFDLEKLELGDELYVVLDPEDQAKYGLEIDFSTVRWWTEQTLEARRVFNAVPRLPLKTGLRSFEIFLNQGAGENSVIWGNGATFDNVILRNAFRAVSYDYPVSYRNDLCYRTVRRLFPNLDPLKAITGVEHNALDDARRQAKTLVEIMRKLRSTLSPEKAMDIVLHYHDIPDDRQIEIKKALATGKPL